MRAGGGVVQEVTTDDREIVSALQAALVDRVGQQRYELWFGANARFAFSELDGAAPSLCVWVPNRFFQDWLRNNFRREVESCCTALLGKSTGVSFQIDESLTADAPSDHNGSLQSPLATAAGAPPIVNQPTPMTVNLPRRSDAPQKKAAATQPHRTTSKPATTRRRYANLDRFVEGPGNRLALATTRMVTEQPGVLSPLVLHGPTGTGKTHLLEGVLTECVRQGRLAVYMSAEQFTSSFLEALHGSGMPNFRRKVRGVDVLMIDDIQFLAGKSSTLGELLHTVDTLARAGKQVVLSCDRPPAELPQLGGEFVARLAGGMVCKLEAPDQPTREGILRSMLDRLDWQLSDEVQRFIAERFSRHARELLGAIHRLRATSTAWGREVDLAFAQEMLADLAPSAPKAINLADIEQAVCDVFGLTGDALKSDKRSKKHSQPRMLAMWLARKYTRSALSEICEHFNRKSHATVISAEKRVERWRSDNEQIDLSGNVARTNDAIRQVEERLRRA